MAFYKHTVRCLQTYGPLHLNIRSIKNKRPYVFLIRKDVIGYGTYITRIQAIDR
jgi:hypothetical protein